MWSSSLCSSQQQQLENTQKRTCRFIISLAHTNYKDVLFGGSCCVTNAHDTFSSLTIRGTRQQKNMITMKTPHTDRY